MLERKMTRRNGKVEWHGNGEVEKAGKVAWDREVQEEAKEQDAGREEDELAEKRWLV